MGAGKTKTAFDYILNKIEHYYKEITNEDGTWEGFMD